MLKNRTGLDERMTGPNNAELESRDYTRVDRAQQMESVHPLTAAGALAPSSSGTKKPAKGTPIAIPTNQRRLSNFSIKTANRALMTGYRDGGSSGMRRKSSTASQGHQSPPFFPHKDDFDIIGTVPGFEKLVEAEASKHIKAKTKATEMSASLNEMEPKDQKPAKRKKTEKDNGGDEIMAAKPVLTGLKGRRRSSASVGSLSVKDVPAIPTPLSPSLHPTSSEPAIRSSLPTTRMSPPTTGGSINRLKHINGFRRESIGGNKTLRSTPVSWPQMPVSCVRVWPRTEFTAAGMSVQFGADRLSLTIKRNTTKVPHMELKFVSYYTASTFKIFQFATRNDFAESSILARQHNSADDSEKTRLVTLFVNTNPSAIVNVCAALKQKGIDTKRLSPEAAEKILTSKSRSPSTSRLPEQPEEA
ncbi:hypothetical protein BC939DRAFT_507783 [Gamsiella multidivaricata]|uniref:uncharacterized protein n=1 Tax=Gamsiella multidivaricata TaxID=101098 RepID=UPI00221FC815|nr:uncharacterized protein BC939DRAFT_507783 [Gamsiella multidivaricata]KAI7816977.1 hypothetical protein BC939DRAFT_507783 [Gamsiella multidivaricata]